jgi:hypothetical protein
MNIPHASARFNGTFASMRPFKLNCRASNATSGFTGPIYGTNRLYGISHIKFNDASAFRRSSFQPFSYFD